MKFWDDEVDNGIDCMFDWDRVGELDRVEKMNELEWLTSPDEEEPEDEDDFPWGWFTENKGFTDQIKREYSHYLHTWVDSCNKSPRELY